jgi:uncharacterized protein YyaL (SSP411 family)
LLKLGEFTGKGIYRDIAEKSLRLVSDIAIRYPTAFARWLSAADFALASVKQIAILHGDGDETVKSFLDAIRTRYKPNIILAASSYPPSNDAPALLMDRTLVEGKTTAYVCENFVCKLPVVGSVQELIKQL